MAPVRVRGLTTHRDYTLQPSAVAAGGFGGVHLVRQHRTLIAKILHRPQPLNSEYTRRVLAVMELDLRDPRVARVVDVLVSADDPRAVVGVMMVLIDNSHTLFSWTNPNERKLLKLKLTPLDRLLLATEIARAFATLHRRRIALADAHHANVLVRRNRRGRAAGVVLIEPDTWIFEWRLNGRMERFCSPARGDFLPPEFQRAELNKTPLTMESDRFALVLLLCLAIFDTLPQSFGGSNLTAQERITMGLEWLTPNLPPGATVPDRLPISPDTVPRPVLKLLQDGLGSDPKSRPSADAFVEELDKWQRDAQDQVTARRFVAALAALVRARTFVDIRQRTVEAFFAAWRRLSANPWAAPATRSWVQPVLKLAFFSAVIGALTVWTVRLGRPAAEAAPQERAKDTKQEEPKASEAKPPKAEAVRRSDWRRLLND